MFPFSIRYNHTHFGIPDSKNSLFTIAPIRLLYVGLCYILSVLFFWPIKLNWYLAQLQLSWPHLNSLVPIPSMYTLLTETPFYNCLPVSTYKILTGQYHHQFPRMLLYPLRFQNLELNLHLSWPLSPSVKATASCMPSSEPNWTSLLYIIWSWSSSILSFVQILHFNCSR